MSGPDEQPPAPAPVGGSDERKRMRAWRRAMLHLLMAIVFCGGYLAGALSVGLGVPVVWFPVVVLGCVGVGFLMMRGPS